MHDLFPLLLAFASSLVLPQSKAPNPGAQKALAPVSLESKGDPAFRPIPGVRELSARLIVRPLQSQVLQARGLSRNDIRRTRLAAQKELSRWELIEYIRQTDESILSLAPGQTEATVCGSLLATGLFQYAEPDWIVYPVEPTRPVQVPAQIASRLSGNQVPIVPTLRPNCSDDPLLQSQWHHSPQILQSCAAWSLDTGTPNISIGICDTGIRTTHEDLQQNRLEGYNAVDRLWESQGGRITPAHFHGTRTTGVAAGNGNNGIGISGVGWNLSHRMLRVSNQSDGGAQLTSLQHAARISIESGDRIASISYHGAYFSSNATTAT